MVKGKRYMPEHVRQRLIEANTGRKISEETRLKMSLAKKGKRPSSYEKIKLLPPWNKGLKASTDERVRNNVEKSRETLLKRYQSGLKIWCSGSKIDREKYPNMGHTKKHSPEAIEKMKKARLGKSAYWNTGDKSPMWKGGVTPEFKKIRSIVEYKKWRNEVFKRDNWTCQKYKKRGGKLHPHHIVNFSEFPELRFEVSNGITLSEKAHKEFHLKFGNSHNTLEQLKQFLS